MHRQINGDYYGFRDDDDGVLAPLEAAAEAEMRAAALEEWREKEQERTVAASAMPSAHDAEERFVAYVPLPDHQEIEARVLAAKKSALLSAYASEALQQQQEDARALLNR